MTKKTRKGPLEGGRRIVPILPAMFRQPNTKAMQDAEAKFGELPPLPADLFDGMVELINGALNSTLDLHQKLSLVYDYLDRTNEFVAQFAKCSKGCSHCCHMSVQLTAFEAEYIQFATQIPAKPDRVFPGTHTSPCPFLGSLGECTIYEVRPLLCRTYHVISDPVLCAVPGAEVLQYGLVEADMSNAVYRHLKEWIYFQNDHGAGGLIKDIRDFFPHDPIAMKHHIRQVAPSRIR